MSDQEQFTQAFAEMVGGQTPQDEIEGEQPTKAPKSDEQPDTDQASPPNPNLAELAVLNNKAKRERDRKLAELFHPMPEPEEES